METIKIAIEKAITNKMTRKSYEYMTANENVSFNPNHNVLEQSLALSYIIESIRRTGEYSADISELIINYLIN